MSKQKETKTDSQIIGEMQRDIVEIAKEMSVEDNPEFEDLDDLLKSLIVRLEVLLMRIERGQFAVMTYSEN